MKIRIRNCIFITFLLLVGGLQAQENRKLISIQGIVKQDNDLTVNQAVYFRLGLYNDTAQTPLWEEQQDTITNAFGLFNLYLGKGVFTGNAQYNDYIQVPWSDPVWLKINYRLNPEDDFKWLGTRKFQAMPYTMYADSASGEGVGIIDLLDVENNEEMDYILKWNGEKWTSSPDAAYAWNVLWADSVNFSDTSQYAWSLMVPVPSDTVDFAFYSDSIQYSIATDTALYSGYSSFSDTTEFAAEVLNAWKIEGNNGDHQIGTLDSLGISIKTNNYIRINITAKGEVLFNAPDIAHADLQTKGTVVLEGRHQPFSLDTTLDNAFYWEPKKSSIVIGNKMSPYFLDTLGRYSFTGGRKSLANSWSFAWGDSCIASGNNMAVFGRNNTASKVALGKKGAGFLLGFNIETPVERTTSIGNNIEYGSLGASSTAIGSHILMIETDVATVIGNHIDNSGRGTLMIGNYLRANGESTSNRYSLMIGDHSTTEYLDNSEDLNNHLYIRAAGGTYFYSDSLSSTGVVLFPGSGSWAMLSDRNRKEHIRLFQWHAWQSNLLANTGIYGWTYRAQQNEIAHIGPMAQEINTRFGFNEDNRRLTMIDMDGLTFSGIRFLINRFEQDEMEIKRLEEKAIQVKEKQMQIEELLKQYESIQKGGKP